MPKFEVGDEVIVVYESGEEAFGSGSGEYFNIGDKGRVLKYHHNDSAVRVEFDDGREYWAQEEELELFSPHVVALMLS